MSNNNIYGFDFLQSTHNSTNITTPADELKATQQPEYYETEQETQYINNKSDLEKQFDVIQFLQTHRSSGCLPPSIIFKSTGVDLSESSKDEKVTQMLMRNSKIRIEEIPDPENETLTIKTFGYLAKFNNIHDKIGLLAQINRCKNGVSLRDLSDAYVGVEQDLAMLITAGDVVAVDNPEDKDKTLFPRGEPFLVELEGNLFLPGDVFTSDKSKLNGTNTTAEEENQTSNGKQRTSPDSESDESDKEDNNNNKDEDAVIQSFNERRLKAVQEKNNSKNTPLKKVDIVKIDVDPKKQVRRGEAIWVAGQWFRVDSRVRDLPLSEQPARAQARPSVVMLKDLSKKNEQDGYIKPFSNDTLPLDSYMTPEAHENLMEAKAARAKLAQMMSHLKTKMKGGHGGGQHHLLNGTDLTSSAILRKRPAGTHRANQSNNAINDAISNVQTAAANKYLVYSHPRRHGTTKDVRDMYLSTISDIPTDPLELYKVLKKTKLIEEGEAMSRPPLIKKRMNVDNDGKPKKRRYYERKNQRFTNWHLHGTEIGAALARAAERQQQGKSVGDGGM